MEIGIDNFVAADPSVEPAQQLQDVLAQIARADSAGVHSFGIGEHHREGFLDSAPVTILAAAAAITERIRLRSAVTVLSADDPVRIFESYATLDLISRGRAELVVGRGSFTEAFPLFGLDLADYDALFTEKLDLLLELRGNAHPHWSGRHRAALTGQGVFPRPHQAVLPIWLGVGGTPASFVRAGVLGLPLMVAIIGGAPRRFRSLIDLYREAGRRAGHPAEQLKVGVHVIGFVADTDEQAAEDFYPGYAEMFTRIGRERGFAPVTRAGYDAQRGPDGPFLIGAPGTVASRARGISDELGGVSRLTVQMTNGRMPHEKMLRSIELLGTEVVPLVDGAAAS
ncbi:MAG: Putative oxidoreductase [uncultured Blastococcus sp.]|uniref:Oxidoreductase n=1 Tax=uncultured Blastococcus sp. TaxID=217144 RepID=A0A6J4HC77_9ACTN|nr:MAG: Putative oxidoreductase [uncultured Blastococcus sp.]